MAHRIAFIVTNDALDAANVLMCAVYQVPLTNNFTVLYSSNGEEPVTHRGSSAVYSDAEYAMPELAQLKALTGIAYQQVSHPDPYMHEETNCGVTGSYTRAYMVLDSVAEALNIIPV